MFCKYKNIFGEPGKGIHSFRIFNIAIVDVIGTILIAYLISKYYKINKNYIYNFFIILLLLFIASILIHKLFCVNTTITKLI